jgi:hypothetical protein
LGEVIQTTKGRVVNTRNLIVTHFKTLAARQFGMQAVQSARTLLFVMRRPRLKQEYRQDTKGFVFILANLWEQSVINEALRALQFLYDVKNQPGGRYKKV